MNKELYLFIIVALFYYSSTAQKPLIGMDGEAWENYGFHQISNDGAYIAYNVFVSGQQGLFLQSTQSLWQISIPGARLVTLTGDSRKMIFSISDSVGIMNLDEQHKVEYLKDIKSFRIVKRGREDDLLIVKQRPDQLVIREIESGEEKSYAGVDNYWAGDGGNVVVLEMTGRGSVTSKYVLNWLDIGKHELRKVWEGKKVEDLKIGHQEEQCAFMVDDMADTGNNSIWVYRHTEGKAAKVLDGQSGLLKGMVITSMIGFNDVSGRIFINLDQPEIHHPIPAGATSVDVWNYRDPILQSEQLATLKAQRQDNTTYEAVLNLVDHQLIRLEYYHESVSSTFYNDKAMHYLLLLKIGDGDGYEWNWNRTSRKEVYLVDLENGKRRLIAHDLGDEGIYNLILSYDERYVFYYDPKVKGYCRYKIGDSTRQNMTANIHSLSKSERSGDGPENPTPAYSAAGLIKNSDAILVYDRHDVFKLDPDSHTPVENLTGKVGRLHDWVFRLAGRNVFAIIDGKEPLCLRVFNKADKSCCLTSITIEPVSAVPSLHFVPYWLDSEPSDKARDKDIYIVERMSAEEHPNLFFTRDFKQYNAITNIYPERAYNWMKTELVTWKTFDGELSQGVLYKPENFDPHRKYPMLIYCYEEFSDRLHRFISPVTSSGQLNIPYYVSHGYLVFTPDIHYKIGRPGRSAYNCVVSGAEYLARRPYLDSKRMGLQGHSFGGFETNYIITRTPLFAAAMSASGISDVISDYNSVMASGESRRFFYELSQMRIGPTLWKRPELYIENSAVLSANKISTPLLIMANKGDGVIPYQQGIELFTALRRLGKRAWMLQYDGEEHVVFGKEAREDLTLRMAQFFNYYLKGEQPPRWLTVGIPARLKEIDSGLGIDSSGAKP